MHHQMLANLLQQTLIAESILHWLGGKHSMEFATGAGYAVELAGLVKAFSSMLENCSYQEVLSLWSRYQDELRKRKGLR